MRAAREMGMTAMRMLPPEVEVQAQAEDRVASHGAC